MDNLGGRTVLKDGAHRDEAVEPVPELARERFADPVRREPLVPEVPVRAVAQGGVSNAAGVQPWVAYIGGARHRAAATRTRDLHGVHVGPVRRVTFELVPALDGTFAELVLVTDDLVMGALFVVADPDRQSQSPIALLGDHPILHIAQPIHLSRIAELGDPLDLIHHVHDLIAQAGGFFLFRDLFARLVVELAHADKPFVDQAEDQRCATAPADGIAMRVLVDPVEQVLVLQVVENIVGDIVDVAPGQPIKAVLEDAVFFQRCQRRQIVDLAQIEVLGATARCDVHDAGTFLLADLFPRDHAMEGRDILRPDRLEFVERPVVGPSDHLCALEPTEDLVLALDDFGQGALGQIVCPAILGSDLHVGQVQSDRRSDVAGQGPRGGGPDQQGFLFAAPQREADHRRIVGQIPIAVGDDLMLADPGFTARAPGHHIVAFVEPTFFPDALQERPDGVVVLGGKGEVGAAQFGHAQLPDDGFGGTGDGAQRPLDGDLLLSIFQQLVGQIAQHVGVVPVHPITEADGLLRLPGCLSQDARLALQNERREAIGLDVVLGFEAHFLLDLDLNPQALAVKAILIALLVAAHGPEPLPKILVGPAPSVVQAHGVVGRDRSVDKGPMRRAFAQLVELFKRLGACPPLQDLALQFDEVTLRAHRFECHGYLPATSLLISYLRTQTRFRPFRDGSVCLLNLLSRYHPGCPAFHGATQSMADTIVLWITGATPGPA